jgi:hypothetical protein
MLPAAKSKPDKPVVIVQHEASRNGAEYCEAWIPAAERNGLRIVAIIFSLERSLAGPQPRR